MSETNYAAPGERVIIAGSKHASQMGTTRAHNLIIAAIACAFTKAYVQMVGRMAYLWGWPLVNVANHSVAFSKASEPGLLVFIFVRGFFEDPKNLTPSAEHLERTKIYPLNGETNAKLMKFPDASGVPSKSDL